MQPVHRADNLTTFIVPIVMKSGSPNLLEPSRSVQACNGRALPFLTSYKTRLFRFRESSVTW